MQPSGARDRVRGAANIAGDERRASGGTGPGAESTQNMPTAASANERPPLRPSTTASDPFVPGYVFGFRCRLYATTFTIDLRGKFGSVGEFSGKRFQCER